MHQKMYNKFRNQLNMEKKIYQSHENRDSFKYKMKEKKKKKLNKMKSSLMGLISHSSAYIFIFHQVVFMSKIKE